METKHFGSLNEVMHHAGDLKRAIMETDRKWRDSVEAYKKARDASAAHELMKYRSELDDLTFQFQDLVRQLTNKDMRAPLNSYDVAEIVWRLTGGKDRTEADRKEGTGDAAAVAQQPVGDGLVSPA